jgi:hypothetical protein
LFERAALLNVITSMNRTLLVVLLGLVLAAPSLLAGEGVYRQEREILIPEGVSVSIVPERALSPQRAVRQQRKIKLAPSERLAVKTGEVEVNELRTLADLNATVEIVCLELGYNFLKDDGVAQVARLASLEELVIWWCRDEVSDEGVRCLAKLTKLRKLHIDCMKGVTPKGWKVLNALEKLEEMRLSDDVRLDAENLGGITQLPRLRDLELSTDGNGLAALSTCATLENLEIEGASSLADLSAFKRHPKLRRLVFENCPAINDDTLALVAAVQHLEVLTLCRCENATDKGVAKLAKASTLKSLSLNSLKLECTCLAAFVEFERLEQLSLSGVECSSANLAGIGLLRGLKQLHISATNKVPVEITKKIVSAPRLESVSFYGLEFNEAAFAELARRDGVAYIRIMDCEGVDSNGVRHLAGLTHLRELDLCDCATVGDKALKALVACEELESLGLRGSGISDAGLAYLKKLRRLSQLNIDGTGVSHVGVKEVCKSASLMELHLIDCPNVGAVSEWWCNNPMAQIWMGTSSAFEILRLEWREDGTFRSHTDFYEPANADPSSEPFKPPPPADPPPNDELG